MKTYTQSSYKKIFTLSFITILSCTIQADVTSNINGDDPTKTLSSLHIDITRLGTTTLATEANLEKLGTSSDVSGIYGLLHTTIPGDITSAVSAIQGTSSSNTLTTIATTLSAFDLVTLGDDITSINASAATVASDTTALSTQVGLLTTQVTTFTDEVADLATHTDITKLGTTSDVSALYATLLQIISTLQSDPIASVNGAASNPALTTLPVLAGETGTADTDLEAYNDGAGGGSINIALAAAATATTTATQNHTNTVAAISALDTAISNFNTLALELNTHGGYVSSGYSVAQISWALQQLNYALAYLLTQQPAA